MKILHRLTALLLALILLSACACAGAETVTWGKLKVDSEITELNLDKAKVTVGNWESFYEFLEKLPNLKKVKMLNSYPKTENVHEIHRRFPNIDFIMTIRFGKHKLRTDSIIFSTLHHEYDKMFGYDEISQVRYCKNLLVLDIGYSPVENLDFLYDLPELRILIAAVCDVTDITPIASLKHLEYLELFRNNITDISCLTSLDHLMDLNLVRNKIADLTPLTEMKSLKRLWLHECNMDVEESPDAATLAMLQEALPDCHIDAVSKSIGGGWRHHSHYRILKRMYTTKKYEPFEDSDPENLPEPYRTRQLEKLEKQKKKQAN
ncbi:MAG: hypothetical protein K6F61_05760 [Clostridiales bacterium]|nr:hypothetical protein [Clostridiales bacterium]